MSFGQSKSYVVGRVRDVLIMADDKGYLASADINGKTILFRSSNGDMEIEQERNRLAGEIFNLIFSVARHELKIETGVEQLNPLFYKNITSETVMYQPNNPEAQAE